MELYPVEQKLVEFEGSQLLGVKANDGKIYVGVRWVVDGIGFTRGQANNQVEKVQKELVLQKGARNFVFQNMEGVGGTQEVLALDIEYLPLWLAKISITPNMVRNNPDLADRLVEYQLNAKDVLARAFLPYQTSNVVQIPTELNMIGQLLEVSNHQFKALVTIQNKLDETTKVAEEAKEEASTLKKELNDVRSGMVDVNLPLRTQFNDAVKTFKGKQQLNWDKAYNTVYEIVGKQHHVNIKLRAERRGKKPIDILEEMNLLVPAIRIAKTLAGVAS